ncbi:unnamed protein product [Caenorhabditis auriculariae]|uniref:DNA-directed RNA polymerase III subunit n=1 Tax=Caenorhabditis auriculariae TaxID=2777116 RepID=A0A8S1GTT9_9PELO|nr:unnamed protein product [Caenorhabditis auriculariae]
MGGRGRGGGGAGNAVRSVASALGIPRHEMGQYGHLKSVEPPPLYPNLQRGPLPFDMTADLIYVSNLRVELEQRFRESPYYLEKEEPRDIKRYTDKYSVVKRGKLQIDMSRLPVELAWRRETKVEKPAAKRRKEDVESVDDVIDKKLRKLEELEKREKHAENDEDGDEKEEEDEKSEKSDTEEQETLSEEDYAEEDNDYISNYFDNGEGDVGSDDNLGEDDY